MQRKFLNLVICAIIFVSCSSASDSSSSSTNTAVSSAQVKALSKIKNIKTKHTSKNGASGLGVFRNLKSCLNT